MRMNKYTVAWWYLAAVLLVGLSMWGAWKLGVVHFIYHADQLLIPATYNVHILTVLGWYILGINIFTFVLFGIDKIIAIRNGKNETAQKRKQHTRVPEFWLMGLSFLGGAFAGIIAMRLFRHKINDWYFVWELPLFIFVHFALFLYIHAAGIM